MADILFVLLCLANQTGTDLQAAFERKLALKTRRDAARHEQRAAKRNLPSTEGSGPPEPVGHRYRLIWWVVRT
jgi:hypothetical protein